MQISANAQAVAYLVSAVLFILALKGLSSPKTARQGVLIGAVGALRELVSNAKPLSANFASLAVESSTAVRQFLAMAQILKHVDADAPIREHEVDCVSEEIDVFNAQTGLEGKYTRISTSKFLPTVLTEFQAGKLMADVLQAPLPVMEMLKAQGVLAPYTSPAAAGYPDWTRKDDQIQTFGIEYVGLIYNKELVKLRFWGEPFAVLDMAEAAADRKARVERLAAEGRASAADLEAALRENVRDNIKALDLFVDVPDLRDD